MKQSNLSKIQEVLTKENLYINEDNKIVLPISLHNIEDGFSPFPYKFNLLSEPVYEYLESFESIHLAPNEIKLEIHIDEKTSDEKINDFSSAIKNKYEKQYIKYNSQIKIKAISSMILLFFGIIVIGIMIWLDYQFFNDRNNIWIEVIDIFAWVLVWEAFDKFIFERKDVKNMAKRAIKFKNAEIEIIKEGTTQQ